MASAPKRAKHLELVDGILPEPPYPAVRSAGWRFQIDTQRMRESDTWTLASAEMRPWLLMLWVASWDNIPSGSLPGSDDLIAAKIGMAPTMFAGNRELLLRGWWKASDGRYYHDVIGDLVIDRIDWKENERQRKQAYRDSLSHGTSRDRQGTPRRVRGTPPESRGMDDTGAGAGAGGKTLEPKSTAIVRLPPDPTVETRAALQGKALRDAAKRVLECLNVNAKRRYEPVDANINMILARMREGYTERDLCAIAAVMARKWTGDEKMEMYIRPKTLFNATNAAQYRAELPMNRIEDANEGLPKLQGPG